MSVCTCLALARMFPLSQHARGGYTTWRARSSCLEVKAELKITATIDSLLKAVSL